MVDKMNPVVMIEKLSSKEALTPQVLASPPVVLDGSELQTSRAEAVPQDCPPELDSNPLPIVHDQPDIYIGNVKLQAEYVQSRGPSSNLPARPYTLSLRRDRTVKSSSGQRRETFVRSNWKGIQHVSVSSSGFFFFRFFSQLAMEDVIDGGPWLVQGQPIVLQPWEQGMSLRRQKHTQIPVWIRLRHLPMEYWTDEGLSTVASGIGTPLYTDGITKACSRLDFARVCIMLDYNSDLPKHLVVISPVLRNGKEDPKRIDVEYEWLPQRCKNCCSLGHVSASCPANMIKTVAPPIKVFVKKQSFQLASNKPEQSIRSTVDLRTAAGSGTSGINKGKDIVLYNSFCALDTDFSKDAEQIEAENNLSMGPKESSPVAHIQRTRRHLLNNWAWFEDYSGPGGRIWITWNPLEVDVDVLEVGTQHSGGAVLVLGDFNAVIDDSEVCGRAADTSASMTEFRNCIRDTELVQLPFTGCPYTWHNCSDGTRSLWKRLDRMLANLALLEVWPSSAYISALPSTSDHSPLILTGMDRITERAIFRFDNYLVQLPGFLESVESIWKHRFIGTAMYDVVCKLKI
ncbi:UNVERIFIED_CONTAM: hypothetical protein Scaly_3035200 [Sesamum calycinum]|uniref:DUF4283 domain-containing protein n=1 Tax=Sesamum calycinum TaxID=2727403 RepID=A0AAW2K7Y4_9LAMI